VILLGIALFVVLYENDNGMKIEKSSMNEEDDILAAYKGTLLA